MSESTFTHPTPSVCDHKNLTFEPSTYAVEVGYKRPTQAQRAAACTPSGRNPKKLAASTTSDDPATFPAAQILPDDDLALDPSYPPQSLLSWTREKLRNKITPERKTIYVAAPPGVHPDVSFVQKWNEPQIPRQMISGVSLGSLQIEKIVDYLSAFYLGLPVKLLPSSSRLQFNSWEDDLNTQETSRKPSKSSSPPYISLNSSVESTRIRTRSSPSGVYTHQLNLKDLLDATISLLPEDAYALLLITSHDLYEDDDDDFVCGRAYGGSRVAVVSTARYHPGLDEIQGVERLHAWPASHCSTYLQEQAGSSQPQKKKGVIVPIRAGHSSVTQEHSPIAVAVDAYRKAYSVPTPTALLSLLTYRVAHTASHELAHCFGLDHCVYFACIMQGSASIQEDARQPPYLCPVDLAKILRATNTTKAERDLKLKRFCDKNGLVWSAFGAWLGARYASFENQSEHTEVIVIDD